MGQERRGVGLAHRARQEGLLVCLRQVAVIWDAQLRRDFMHRFGQNARVFADVHAGEEQAEGFGAVDPVLQLAGGEFVMAVFAQAFLRQFQRRHQLAAGGEGAGGGGFAGVGFGALLQTVADDAQEGLVAFARRFLGNGGGGLRVGGDGAGDFRLHGGVAVVAVQGEGQQVVHLIAVIQMQAHGFAAQKTQSFAGHGRGDEGVAVAVAADPGAETHKRRNFKRMAGIGAVQAAAHLAVQTGDGLPQRAAYKHVALGLVEHGGALLLQGFSLPQTGQLGAQLAGEHLALARQQITAVGFGQGFAQAAQGVAHGAALGFGRVGGEHQFQLQLAQMGLHFFGGQAALFERFQRRAQRLAARGRPGQALALAQNADAVAVLGHVGQVEKAGHGPDQATEVRGGDARDFGAQGGIGTGFARAAVFGQGADFFDQIK